MTLVVAWVRTANNGYEELVVAADSRIRSGGVLDCAPKLLALPRNDSVLAFAGDTYYAYPLLLQLANAVTSHSPLLSRAIDYPKLRTHTLAIFNSVVESFRGDAMDFEKPEFVLAGYSWRKKRFEVDHIIYNPTEQLFQFRGSLRGIGAFGRIMHAGDWKKKARANLNATLASKHGVVSLTSESTVKHRFSWEPLANLRDLLRTAEMEEGDSATIGGPPQVVRVTPYLECRPTAVRWKVNDEKAVCLYGRPLLPYEHSEAWILDPDTMSLTHPRYTETDLGPGQHLLPEP